MSHRGHLSIAFAIFAFGNGASADGLSPGAAAGLGAAAAAAGAIVLSGNKSNAAEISSTTSQPVGANQSLTSGNAAGNNNSNATANNNNSTAGMLSPGGAAGFSVGGTLDLAGSNSYFGGTQISGDLNGLFTLAISGTGLVIVNGTISSSSTTH